VLFFHFDHLGKNRSHAQSIAVGGVDSCQEWRDKIIVNLPAESAAEKVTHGFVFWGF
jgi:hypothetical protein